jgi:hypothetical protein
MCGNWKFGVLLSEGRMMGELLPESVPEPCIC